MGIIDCTISHLWKLKIPLRIKFFLWLASRNRVLTADTLSKRGWQGPSIYSLCCKNEEKLEHLLFECKFAVSLWINLLHGILNTTHLLLNLPSRWSRARKPQSGQARLLFDLFFTATCWELWKERNTRIFENRETGSGEVGNKVFSSVILWNSIMRE